MATTNESSSTTLPQVSENNYVMYMLDFCTDSRVRDGIYTYGEEPTIVCINGVYYGDKPSSEA